MTQTLRMPSVYVPHGGGPAFFMQGEMRMMFQPMADFLSTIAGHLPATPSAILVVTAHWEASRVTISGGTEPELIYDYGGFPPDMYELTYPAPGEPDLAERALDLLRESGIDSEVDAGHGLDHGVFIPLKVMYPEASIPVVAMSLQAGLNPLDHVAVGSALAPLRDEGVLIVGSGLSWHNMGRIANGDADSISFDRWLDGALDGDQAHRREQLGRWTEAPAARAAHPREEHLLPLMVASGAGSDLAARKLWEGLVNTSRVSAWAFD